MRDRYDPSAARRNPRQASYPELIVFGMHVRSTLVAVIFWRLRGYPKSLHGSVDRADEEGDFLERHDRGGPPKLLQRLQQVVAAEIVVSQRGVTMPFDALQRDVEPDPAGSTEPDGHRAALAGLVVIVVDVIDEGFDGAAAVESGLADPADADLHAVQVS